MRGMPRYTTQPAHFGGYCALKQVVRSRRLNIFISYRRKESSGYSGRIYDRLRDELPEAEVFMDVEEIALGARWRDVLAERLRAADTVIVLIGAEWRSMRDASGRRRLDDPDDVTRWELETALALGKRLVPVLLDHASPLSADELPQSLRPLAELQALRIAHETFDTGLGELVARLSGEDSMGQAYRETKRRLRLERAKRWGVPAIALAMVLLALTRVFDLFALDTRIATWTLAFADAASPQPLDPELMLIGIGTEHVPADSEMRARYAQLLAALARAGSRAAVLDLYFHVPKTVDAELASAMHAARAAGMQVFFGFIETQGGQPRAVPELAAAATAMGLACAGRRLGYAVSIPLAFDIAPHDNRWRVSPLPALALLGAAGDVRIEGIDARSRTIDVRNSTAANRWGFSMLGNKIGSKQACGAIQKGTRVAEIVVRISPLEQLRTRRMTLDDVLGGRVATERLAGKTVVIGYETTDETFAVAHGFARETRFGYELQADAINGLMSNRVTRFAGPGVQIAMAACMATLGAALGARLCRRSRGYVCVVAALVMAVYLIVAVAVAAVEDLLLMSAYDISAFLLAYVPFRILARRSKR